jgi:phosphinothricin acetyltransferase
MEKEMIRIRVATVEDAKAILEIYAPYVRETAITFEYDVPSMEEFARRIQQILLKYPYLVAEKDGEILGFAYAGAFHERAAFNWAVETSIYVKMNRKRLGIGNKLYEALECVLKEQKILNLNACIAYPDEEDEYLTKDSVVFHEKWGYKPSGKVHQCGYKFNRWYHILWMEKHIGKHRQFPPETKTFGEVIEIVKSKYGIHHESTKAK